MDESLQLLIYFGGLVTVSIASISYLLTRKTWIASVIIFPMFFFISIYSAYQLYVILIGVAFSLLAYLMSIAVKALLNRDKKAS